MLSAFLESITASFEYELSLLEEETGIDILQKLKFLQPKIQIIYLSSQEKVNVALKSLRAGAFAYLEKNDSDLVKLPFIIEQIEQLKTNRK